MIFNASNRTRSACLSYVILTCLLLILAGKASAQDLVLQPGTTDTGQYGWRWGNNANIEVVTAAFQGTGSDLNVHVTGFDVDNTTEVSVSVNGNLLGYLPVGPNNNRLSSQASFLIPAVDQRSGTNTIEFTQSRRGWKWGVTNILLQRTDFTDISIVPGIEVNAQLGWRWGTNSNRDSVVVAFDNTGIDTTMSVAGYDIDTDTEVIVYMNGYFVGFLPRSSNNRLNSGSTFPIRAADQIPGVNTIEFKQNGGSGWIWV